MQKILSNLKTEILEHKVIYLFLTFVLLGAIFVRVYRMNKVLGFYYDQGRDALVIWDLWHKGKFFLIGPTTGIAGIFRGPFYYYLIAPLYLIGKGDPVWPADFLGLTSVVAIIILYYLVSQIVDRTTGVIAVIIASFSFYIVLASRWLSNPTPMLLISMLLIFSIKKILEGKKSYWILLSFLAGISLFHFGSSGEFFYFPALFLFFIWQFLFRRNNLPTKMIFISSALVFLFTMSPLVIFDIKHNGILRENIRKFIVDDESFKASFWDVFQTRLNFYYTTFTSKIFDRRGPQEKAILGIVALSLLVSLPKLIKSDVLKISLLLFLAPIIGLLFFQGNDGNIYDYYLTGYYLIFILLFAVGLGVMWRFTVGKLFIIIFLWLFFTGNLNILKARITDGVDGPHTIAFGNEKQAMDWIYADAKKQGLPFNTDFYVPPVIPYTYQYLDTWYGPTYYNLTSEKNNVPLLYTLYEQDPPHPERLRAWLKRQTSIGKVVDSTQFGGITIERRERITPQK